MSYLHVYKTAAFYYSVTIAGPRSAVSNMSKEIGFKATKQETRNKKQSQEIGII